MIKIIICLIIIIVIIICLLDYNENFEADFNTNTNCCVIRKERLNSNFVYTFQKSKYCDNYHDNYLRVIKEGELVSGEEFTMDECENPENKESSTFGSCRKLGGFECIDFVSEVDCKKFDETLIWEPVSCNNKTSIELNHYKTAVDKLLKYEVSSI